jgi:hypothetical protein
MYKQPFTNYLVVTYFPTYLPTYIWMRDLFPTTKMVYQGETKLLTRVEVHPQLSNNGHPSSGWCTLVGAAGSWCVWILDVHSLMILLLFFLFRSVLFFSSETRRQNRKGPSKREREREREKEREIRSWVISCSSFQLSQKRISVFCWPSLHKREREREREREELWSLIDLLNAHCCSAFCW